MAAAKTAASPAASAGSPSSSTAPPASSPSNAAPSTPADQPPKAERAIARARDDIADLLKKQKNLAAAFLKLAFFDATTYDAKSKTGGPNGSIRLRDDSEKDDLLMDAIQRLGELKSTDNTTEKLYQYISYADLFQLAGVEATNMLAEKKIIEFEPGRMDSYIPPSTKLRPLTGDENASDVRDVFYRMGFDDKEIVALSWAYYCWETCKASTSTTLGGKTEPTTPTPLPKLDDSYYKSLKNLAEATNKEKPTKDSASTKTNETQNKSGDKETTSSVGGGAAAAARTNQLKYHWKCLLLEKPFAEHVITYATKEGQFVMDFAAAYKKMSELGFKEPQAPVTEYHDMRHGLAVAVVVTILVGVLGFFYETIRT